MVETDVSPPTEDRGTTAVDLVVVIDGSASLQAVAAALDQAAETALQAVSTKCPADVRLVWLGIERRWPETRFAQAYRAYLVKRGVAVAEMVISQPNRAKNGQPQKDAAAAILDLAHHFDWRPEAARAIFVVGDGPLRGGEPQTKMEIAATNLAISMARQREVSVFTYANLSPDDEQAESVLATYHRVATETGGRAYTAPVETWGGFQTVLAEVVCLAAGLGGSNPPPPEIQPCFELNWGDGPNDRIETDDEETLCLIARNPYPNLIFKEVTLIFSEMTDLEGNPIRQLPDGTPSVEIVPAEMISFGDLPPANGQPSEVAREVVLIGRRAQPDDYYFNFEYGYRVEFTYQDRWQAPFSLRPNWRRWWPILLLLLLPLLCCIMLWCLWPAIEADPNGPYQIHETHELQVDGRRSSGFNIVEYESDFGDGEPGRGVTATHIYDDGPQQFTVTLTITDSLGRSESDTTQTTVINLPPTANAGGPYECVISQTIQLSGHCSDPSQTDSETLGCTWSALSGAVISESTFLCPAEPGCATVILTAADKDGGRDQDKACVNVKPLPTPPISPTAIISITLRDKDDLTYGFDGSGSSDPDGSIERYNWDLGDGSSAFSINPIHTYPTRGPYTVSLTVTDNDGYTGTTSIRIPVFP